MATRTLQTLDRRTDFDTLTERWIGRLRRRDLIRWLPRSLAAALMLCVILAMVTRVRFLFSSSQLMVVSAAAVLGALLALILFVRTRQHHPVDAARDMDIEFRLQEKFSTALELMDGRIRSTEEIRARQIEDAWETIRTIDPKEGLEIKVRWVEWAIVVWLLITLVILLLIPNQLDPLLSNPARAAQEAAIDQAEETLRDITEVVAADTTLDDAEQQDLLESLETNLNTLQEENIRPEEAFAAMSDVEAQLRDRSEELANRAQSQQSALDAAAERLENLPSRQEEASLEIPSLEQILTEAQENLDGLTESELQQAAQAFSEAGQQAAQSDQNLAESFENLAEALRQNDQQAAQDALDQAQQDLQQAQQNQQQQQEAAENLQQAADQAQQSAENIAQGEQQSQQQEGQAPAPDGEEAQAQGQDGQQPSSQQSGGQPGQIQQGQNQSESQQQALVEAGAQNQSGSGDNSAGGADSEGGFDEQVGQINQNNNPDGGGESQFEEIYAPRRIGGQSSEEIILEPDASDLPVTEGEFSENPTGESIVSYDQVFNTYQDAVNRALESDYVPLGLRDVVRDYFTSLQPDR